MGKAESLKKKAIKKITNDKIITITEVLSVNKNNKPKKKFIGKKFKFAKTRSKLTILKLKIPLAKALHKKYFNVASLEL